MTVTIMGATGHLGGLVVGALLARGQSASEIIAVGRDESRLVALGALGVSARRADYDAPESVDDAVAGADTVLLISATDVGRRFAQHRAVIDAAQRAGVTRLVYTSVVNAGTATTILAAEHRQTEEYLRSAGLEYVVLRNGWYHENFTDQIPGYLERGIVGSGGAGRISGAARADYADAAAAVLTGPWPGSRTFELGGPAYTLTDVAAEISQQTGDEVRYVDLPAEVYQGILESAGLAAPVAAMLADADVGLASGALFVDGTDLGDLIGRPPTTLAHAVAQAVAGGGHAR